MVKVTVTQVFMVECQIVLDVEADDAESATDLVLSGAVDLPGHDDPRWARGWTLESENAKAT